MKRVARGAQGPPAVNVVLMDGVDGAGERLLRMIAFASSKHRTRRFAIYVLTERRPAYIESLRPFLSNNISFSLVVRSLRPGDLPSLLSEIEGPIYAVVPRDRQEVARALLERGAVVEVA
ncbi:MAG: hypothetical protein ABWK00_01375 [Desulfurococcaceae archaeon]